MPPAPDASLSRWLDYARCRHSHAMPYYYAESYGAICLGALHAAMRAPYATPLRQYAFDIIMPDVVSSPVITLLMINTPYWRQHLYCLRQPSYIVILNTALRLMLIRLLHAAYFIIDTCAMPKRANIFIAAMPRYYCRLRHAADVITPLIVHYYCRLCYYVKMAFLPLRFMMSLLRHAVTPFTPPLRRCHWGHEVLRPSRHQNKDFHACQLNISSRSSLQLRQHVRYATLYYY